LELSYRGGDSPLDHSVALVSSNFFGAICFTTFCQVVHDDDEDEFLQKIGFRVDGIMNSSYHCVLYTLNIFLLFWTDDVVEIILNALAIEFIKEIDGNLSIICFNVQYFTNSFGVSTLVMFPFLRNYLLFGLVRWVGLPLPQGWRNRYGHSALR